MYVYIHLCQNLGANVRLKKANSVRILPLTVNCVGNTSVWSEQGVMTLHLHRHVHLELPPDLPQDPPPDLPPDPHRPRPQSVRVVMDASTDQHYRVSI